MDRRVAELAGERVVLRDWNATDVDVLPGLLDPARPWHLTNAPYFGTPSQTDLDDVVTRIQAKLDSGPDQLPIPRHDLAVAERSSNQLVGMVSWYFECEATDWRRMGLVLYDETVWGRGYGTEALALWTTYLFATTDALRVDFATYSGNHGMLAVGRRLGFTCEALLRRARRWSGGVHDGIVMATLREEWDGRAEPRQGTPIGAYPVEPQAVPDSER